MVSTGEPGDAAFAMYRFLPVFELKVSLGLMASVVLIVAPVELFAGVRVTIVGAAREVNCQSVLAVKNERIAPSAVLKSLGSTRIKYCVLKSSGEHKLNVTEFPLTTAALAHALWLRFIKISPFWATVAPPTVAGGFAAI